MSLACSPSEWLIRPFAQPANGLEATRDCDVYGIGAEIIRADYLDYSHEQYGRGAASYNLRYTKGISAIL